MLEISSKYHPSTAPLWTSVSFRGPSFLYLTDSVAIMSEVTDQVEFFESEQIDSEPHTLEQETECEKEEKLLKLPLSRIRTIIKQDPDVHLASHDSVVLISKATVTTFRLHIVICVV